MGYTQDLRTPAHWHFGSEIKQAPYAGRLITEKIPFLRSMIISFSSPSSFAPVSHRLGAGASEDDLVYMDDDDEFEAENAKITSPGESITSARAFMR
jgi:hypothetical protein